ncbi:MAG TPA: TadG family pilus assembly protein [Planctomycetaceae bacterium]|nr:TadG family pilus assembly protein [Planctomycetaceae bacterium]
MSPSSTTARDLSAGHAGLALVLVGAAVFAIHTAVVFAADAQARAEIQAEAHSAAEAAALGSVLEVPHGAVAVLRAASRIVGMHDPRHLMRGAQQVVQVGHWDAGSGRFVTGSGKANAVQVTIRVRREPPSLAMVGNTEDEVEVQAIAVLRPAGKSLVAEATEISTGVTR